MSLAAAQLFLCSLFVWPFVFSWKQEGARRRRGDKGKKAGEGLKGVALFSPGSLASAARKHVLLFRIRGDAAAGAESYFCCIYTADCLEVWELCTLFCKSRRQPGDKQDGLEHSDRVCVSLRGYLRAPLSLLFNHCDLAWALGTGTLLSSCGFLKMPRSNKTNTDPRLPPPPPSPWHTGTGQGDFSMDRRTFSLTSSFSCSAETARLRRQDGHCRGTGHCIQGTGFMVRNADS